MSAPVGFALWIGSAAAHVPTVAAWDVTLDAEGRGELVERAIVAEVPGLRVALAGCEAGPPSTWCATGALRRPGPCDGAPESVTEVRRALACRGGTLEVAELPPGWLVVATVRTPEGAVRRALRETGDAVPLRVPRSTPTLPAWSAGVLGLVVAAALRPRRVAHLVGVTAAWWLVRSLAG